MRKIKLSVFTAAILFVVSGGFQTAFAQDTVTAGGPAGSYRDSCKNIQTVNNILLIAECNEPKGSFLKGGGIVTDNTSLNYFFTCEDNSITNRNGKLCCTRNINNDKFKTAAKSFDAVSARLGGGIYFFSDEPDLEIQHWLAQHYMRGFGANYAKGLTQSEASGTVSDYIRKTPKFHSEIVHLAFQTVYKRNANDGELNAWTPRIAAGKKFYYSIVEDLEKTKKAEGTLKPS